MRRQHLLLPQHLWKPLLLPQPTLHLLQPTLLQPLPWLARLKPLPVQLLTPLPLALLMLPKPLSTLLLKPPKPLPSQHSNCCSRVQCPGTKKPPLGGFLLWCAVGRATYSFAGYFRSLASN